MGGAEETDFVITCGNCHPINMQLFKNGLISSLDDTMVWDSRKKRTVKIGATDSQDSFSQNGEDIYLKNRFSQIKNGFFVDIGALDPFRFSNTYWAHKAGWKGVNIDPNPEVMEKFEAYRKNDINLNIGISDKEGTAKYYMFDEPAFNTFDEDFGRLYISNNELKREIHVPVRRLDTIFKEYGVKKIHFMDIDTENYEMHVLRSNDWNCYRPEVILVEQFFRHRLANVEEIIKSEIYLFLKEIGYIFTNKYRSTVIYEDREVNNKNCPRVNNKGESWGD